MTVTLDIEVEELEALTSDATEVLFESSNSDLTITPDSLLLSSLISGGKILIFGGKWLERLLFGNQSSKSKMQ